MKLFMTSVLGGYVRGETGYVPSPIWSANGLLDKIKSYWPQDAKVLIICSDPGNFAKNDDLLSCYRESLPASGLPYSSLEFCDLRNESAVDKIADTDVLIFLGGHVPTQNAFMKKIGLREKLSAFDGIILAMSAGSMNCADTVYAGPEEPGEAIDPDYQRWISGLGLTNVNIFPHFQNLRHDVLDGLRLIEDITFADSMGHELIALNDESYIFSDGETETIVGEAYSILDAVITKICDKGESLVL